MANIRYIRKRKAAPKKPIKGPKFPGLSQPHLDPAVSTPPPTDKPRERCKIAMEMGASHTRIMVRRPGKDWEYVKFGRGAGASSISGVDVVPTMTAVRSKQESLEIRHGVSALNARIADSRSWTVVQHLKHAYLNEAPTEEVRRTLSRQKEMARERGWDIQDLADQYFYDILSTAAKEDIEAPLLYTNISDVWPNEVAQRLIRGFHKVLPGAEVRGVHGVHGVDECLSSLIGAMSMEAVAVSETTYLVYVDCGHATMEICAVTINPSEPRFVVHPGSHRSEPLGAGMIDMAVENELRAMNEDAKADDIEKGVWETLQFINEHVKPDMDSEFAARAGIEETDWRRLLRVTREADKRLNMAQIECIVDLMRKTYVAGRDNRLLLTGGASLSRTFLARLQITLKDEFPDVKLLHKVEERSYVLSGLICIADDETALSVDAAPLSLWMRSDPDSESDEEGSGTGEEEQEEAEAAEAAEAVRICRQGQAIDPKTVGKFDRNPSHPIHYELVCKDGHPEIDLSVFGTPSGISDDDVIVRKGEAGGVGKSHECLVFSQPEKLTRFGTFREELQMQTRQADGTYHAYVFSKITRVGITLFAVFADDGHGIPALENKSVNGVLQGPSLSSEWSTHDGVKLNLIRLGQVARPEMMVGSPGADAAPGKRIDSIKRSASKTNRDPNRRKRQRVDDELIL